jgi:Right handed beta helix region
MRTRMSAGWWTAAIAAVLLGMAMPVIAGDGQIDIAELPYTITEPGSYVVVANLTLTDLDTDGITIETDNVTIDLNGHTLTGPGKSPLTTRDGIHCDGYENIVVANGTAREFGDQGIGFLGASACQVSRVHGLSNGRDGIIVGYNSIVSDCISRDNGGYGIRAGEGSLIRNNVVRNNTSTGIYAETGSAIMGNTVRDSGVRGINGQYSLISNNASTSNSSDNIYNLGGVAVDNYGP